MTKNTLKSISEATGFSIPTVSRVLSGKATECRISRKTAESIVKEAIRQGYKPSGASRQPDIKGDHVVGLLLPSISNPFFADLADAIVPLLDKNGFTVNILNTMEDSGRMMDGIRSLIMRNADGVLTVPCGEYDPEFDELGTRIPIVSMDRHYEKSDLPHVVTNNYLGGYEATKRLIDKGHRSIACIQGVETSSANRERVRGYVQAMNEYGLGDKIRICGDEFSIPNGHHQMLSLIHSGRVPTAVFALSGTIALGVIKAIREASLRIPDDIALLSFDNNSYMDFMTPSVSRMGQPIASIADLSVKLLIDRISGKHNFNSKIRLTPTYIAGESI